METLKIIVLIVLYLPIVLYRIVRFALYLILRFKVPRRICFRIQKRDRERTRTNRYVVFNQNTLLALFIFPKKEIIIRAAENQLDPNNAEEEKFLSHRKAGKLWFWF